jgi:hypothetical protein
VPSTHLGCISVRRVMYFCIAASGDMVPNLCQAFLAHATKNGPRHHSAIPALKPCHYTFCHPIGYPSSYPFYGMPSPSKPNKQLELNGLHPSFDDTEIRNISSMKQQVFLLCTMSLLPFFPNIWTVTRSHEKYSFILGWCS